MRRVLAWAAGVGLLAGLSLLLVAPAGGQTVSITLTWSLYDVGSNTWSTAGTSVNEGALVEASVRATTPSNVTSPVTVSVTMGASGSTATLGSSCTATTVINILGVPTVTSISNCGGDYGVYGGGSVNDATFDITIPAGSDNASGTGWIRATSDRVTENNEIVRISGTTATAGYSVGNHLDITINDEDRTILLTGPARRAQEGQFFLASGHTNFIKAELGSGSNRGNFVASTSSTYSSVMNLRILVRAKTMPALSFQFTMNQNNHARFVKIDANSVSSNILVDSQGRGGAFGQIALTIPPNSNTVAEGDKSVEFYFGNVPADFTVLPYEVFQSDDDDDISLSVDTDSGEDGVQSLLAEGDSGSGAVVSAAFPAATTSSTISSATVVTVSAAGAASPGAGVAGTADLSYAPSTPNTITFPAESLTPSGTTTLAGLTVADDSVVEGPETFTVGGSSDVGDAGGAVVTIVDDDADVALSVSPGEVEEGPDGAEVTVTARFAGSSSVLTAATEVTVSLAGAAVNGAALGSDFTVSGAGGTSVTGGNEFTVSIPAGELAGSAVVRVTAPADADGREVVAVSGAAEVGGLSVGVEGVELGIVDPGISLSFHEADSGEAALSEISEGGGSRTVRVRAEASAAVSGSTTVAVTVGAAGGTAASCTGSGQSRVCPDFTPGADTVSIVIPAGQRRGAADVTIAPVVDTVAEGRETIRFSGSATGYVVTGADLGITDTIEVTLSSGSVGEGAGNAGSVTATAGFLGATSSTLTDPVDVTLSFAAGAGAEAADFTAPGTVVTLRIPARNPSSNGVALSGLLITGDTSAEGPEVINVGGAAEGFAVTGTALTIADDDLEVTLVADTDSGMSGEQKGLSEGGAVGVRVRASLGSGVANELGGDLLVSVSVVEVSPVSAAGGGVDFTAPASPVSVVIPAGGRQSGWVALAGLGVVDDLAAEGAETFQVAGTVAVPGGTVVADTLTIGVSDVELGVSVSPGTVVEGAGYTTVRVAAGFRNATSSELSAQWSVTVTVASGDVNGASLTTTCASFTEDVCVGGTLFAVAIPTGQTSGSSTFTVTARDDGVAEAGGETLQVTGTTGPGNSASATLRVVDSGVIRVEFLNPADDSALSSVGEGDGAVPVRVRVTMPAAANTRRVVGLNIAGDADTGEDTDGVFTMLEDFRVSGVSNPVGTPGGHELGVEVAANQTVGTADFTITIHDDNVDESDKTIRVTGSDVGSLPVLESSLRITDNDDPPGNVDLEVVSFHDANGGPADAVLEDGGTTRVRVRASFQGAKVLSKSVTIPLTVGKSSDSATSGTDYQAVTGARVTIPAYQSSGENTFSLVIGNAENDSSVEGPESVTIDGGSAIGFSFTYATASFAIVDDDIKVHLELSDSSDQPLARLREGDPSQTVTVRASYTGSNTRTTAQTVQVNIGGTVSASDYQAGFSATPFNIEIPANQNAHTGTFTLVAQDDNLYEGDETLLVDGALEGYAVVPAEVTIVDTDPSPRLTLSVNPGRVPENRGTSPLTVTVTAALAGSLLPQPTEVRVTIAGSGTTASRGNDYNNLSPRSLTITIPAERRSAQRTFRVVILSDTRSEQTERISVRGVAADLNNATHTAYLQITNIEPADPVGGGGGGAPPPSGGGGGGGGGAPPPVGPPAPPPPPAPVCQGRFCDDDGSVHQANIEQIAAWEITLGCDADDATKFCPSAQITRRQMAAFLHRAVNRISPITPPTGIEINDVPTDAWYRTFADWVVSTGAFAAPDGVFNPGGVVTRADMAVMMIASFPDINAVDEPEGLFNDVAGADPEVVRAVEGMYHTGVTRGCSTTPLNYCPDQPVTRAQMASFFVRAVNYTPPAADS